jgi:hypothetical protein
MELWNDFEGKTVDGQFELDHLIGPKGRSAYFTTKDAAGAAAVIRLIESLNDEEEILRRWRTVTGLKQEHLLGLLACGQTVLDGTHLVYAVMEPTDMELADVLRQRALTAEETRQIAISVADGLEALHAKGLVHEHVEADNILAQGETVKLRSDVVREAPEGAEGAAARTKDVHDLSVLLVRCLTRGRSLEGTRLPTPFDEVVRKGESGAWGLNEILMALRPMGAPVARPVQPVGAPVSSSAPVRPSAPVAGPGVRGVAASGASSATSAPAAGQVVAPGAGRADAPVAVSGAALGVASSGPAAVASRLASQSDGDGVGAHLRTPRAPDRIVMEPQEEPRRTGLLIGVIAGVLVLLLLGLHFFRASRTGQTRSVVQDNPSAVTVPQQSGDNRPSAHEEASAPVPHRTDEKPSAVVGDASRGASGRAGRAVTGAAAAGSSEQWRVVAFTYNRQDQAEQKARTIGAQHPVLRPEVYSPSGRAPYLVTLGGWMSKGQASALRSRARSKGLPRDMYMQNYRGR